MQKTTVETQITITNGIMMATILVGKVGNNHRQLGEVEALVATMARLRSISVMKKMVKAITHQVL